MSVDGTATAVDRTERRAAVLGSPIKHSLSPVLHGAAYEALELARLALRHDRVRRAGPAAPG